MPRSHSRRAGVASERLPFACHGYGMYHVVLLQVTQTACGDATQQSKTKQNKTKSAGEAFPIHFTDTGLTTERSSEKSHERERQRAGESEATSGQTRTHDECVGMRQEKVKMQSYSVE